jgi:hypothetical protein
MSLPSRLLGANPSIQVSTLLSGSLSTPSAKLAFSDTPFQSIATVSVGSGGTSTVSFTSIPSTFVHLQIRFIVRENTGSVSNTSDNFRIRYNGDTGSNYSLQRIFQNENNNNAGDFYANQTDVVASGLAGASTTASVFSGGIIDIYNYANTNMYKSMKSKMGSVNATNGGIFYTGGVWRNTNAITSIELRPDTGDLAQYSHVALYGIRGS